MNPRRDVPKYVPPIGGRPAPQAVKPPDKPALPPPEPKPPGVQATQGKPQRRRESTPEADKTTPVGTRLEPAELAKLDRVRKRLGGSIQASRSAALRWLVQRFDESTI